MKKLERPPAPACLKDKYRDTKRPNYRQWGHNYKKKILDSQSVNFTWPSYKGQKVDELIREELKRMTSGRCSFCNFYPLETAAQPTIEHFRAKAKYPGLAYTWHNLFLCCNACQSAKGVKSHEKLLKPDRADYDFHDYFEFNYKTGEIKVNPSTSEENQEKARITIDVYGLNKGARPRKRLDTIKLYEDLNEKRNDYLDILPYNFFLI